MSSKKSNLKILLFSGGTASKEFQKKLYEMGFIVDNIINCYDDGLSTGEVRKAFDWNILGPSDLRKNQLVKYEALHGKTPYYELLSKRFTLKDPSELKEYLYKEIDKYIKEMVNNKTLKVGVDFFINNSKYKSINYNDFSLANIIYAGFFYKYGVQRTHDIFKKLLKIKGDVIVNDETPFILGAYTNKGKIISFERDVVFWNNPEDKIKGISLTKYHIDGKQYFPVLSDKPKDKIKGADIIIFFAGTQWSSLIPTYKSSDLFDNIITSKASKFLVLNNENDIDMLNVTNSELLEILRKYIPLKADDCKINVIYNEDSILDQPPSCLIGNFGTGKKHDVEKLSLFILKEYFKELIKKNKYKKFIFDYDYTLFNYKDKITTNENKILFKDFICKKYKPIITTGNTYKHIINTFGSFRKEPIIYSDNGMIKNNIELYDKSKLSNEEANIIEKILNGIKHDVIKLYDNKILYRIKNYFEGREEKIKELNKKLPYGLKAFKRGISSIEIHKEFVTKLDYIYENENLDDCIYLGDENLGNDEIFFRLYDYIKITDIRITNAFLQAMSELK